MNGQAEAAMRYSTARGYMFACKMVYLSPQRAGREIAIILPMHMLAGFALELFLKAWLLQVGMPSKDVRKLGHNIHALYDLSNQKGLPNITGLASVVDVLADPHGDFTYRYMDDATKIVVMGWQGAFPVFDELDKAVDAFVGASVSQGLLPGH